MKVCYSCKVDKSLDEFYKNARASDGLMYSCKQCKKLKDKEKYLKAKELGKILAYKEKNKEKISTYNKEYQRTYRSSGRKQQRKLEMCNLLGGECARCKLETTVYNIAVFDFHHKNENSKEYDPSDMVNMSWERIKSELTKCEMLCSNCHRMHHYGTSVLDDIGGWDDL